MRVTAPVERAALKFNARLVRQFCLFTSVLETEPLGFQGCDLETKMTKKPPSTTGERMTADERLAFIRRIAKTHCLSHLDLTKYTGYLLDTVSGWFTSCNSLRHRHVSARAVDRLLLELALGHVKSSKSAAGA